MQSGKISDGQLMSPKSDETAVNPWGGRLNSGGDGWLPRNSFYRVNLKKLYLIMYMTYTATPIEEETTPYSNLVFKYAVTQNAFQTVKENVEGTESVRTLSSCL